MKVLLDIPDNMAASLMAVLKSIPHIKAKTISTHKAEVLEGIKEAVEEMNLIKKGKLKARNAEDLFNEL